MPAERLSCSLCARKKEDALRYRLIQQTETTHGQEWRAAHAEPFQFAYDDGQPARVLYRSSVAMSMAPTYSLVNTVQLCRLCKREVYAFVAAFGVDAEITHLEGTERRAALQAQRRLADVKALWWSEEEHSRQVSKTFREAEVIEKQLMRFERRRMLSDSVRGKLQDALEETQQRAIDAQAEIERARVYEERWQNRRERWKKRLEGEARFVAHLKVASEAPAERRELRRTLSEVRFASAHAPQAVGGMLAEAVEAAAKRRQLQHWRAEAARVQDSMTQREERREQLKAEAEAEVRATTTAIFNIARQDVTAAGGAAGGGGGGGPVTLDWKAILDEREHERRLAEARREKARILAQAEEAKQREERRLKRLALQARQREREATNNQRMLEEERAQRRVDRFWGLDERRRQERLRVQRERRRVRAQQRKLNDVLHGIHVESSARMSGQLGEP